MTNLGKSATYQMSKRVRLLSSILLITLLTVSLEAHSTELAESTVDYDTTRVRDVQPVKKSTGEVIADVPGEILKLPVYALTLVARTVIQPPVSFSFSLLTLPRVKRSYIPVLGYSSRAGLKLGFGKDFINDVSTGHRLNLKSYYSTNDYQSYKLRFFSPRLFSPNIGLNLSAIYKKKTRMSYYGFGMASDRDNEVNVTWENTQFRGNLPVKLTRSVNLTFDAGAEITNLYDGRDPDLEGRLDTIKVDTKLNLVSGQLDAFRQIDMGVKLEFDRRNSVSRPTGGAHLIGNFKRIIGVGRSDGRDFTVYGFDFRQYIDVWRNRVLALRTSFSRLDNTDSNTKGTPFYLSKKLGGLETLRGFTTGRFIDNDVAHASVEYRYPIYSQVDAFLFWDAGRVFSDVHDEKVFDGWRDARGFGLRLWNDERTIAVIQVANSDESTRFYFEMGASW